MSSKVILVCLAVGLVVVNAAPQPEPHILDIQDDLQAVVNRDLQQLVENLRGCYNDVDERSQQIGSHMKAAFDELLEKSSRGRQYIADCESQRASVEEFSNCYFPKVINLADEAVKSLSDLRQALSQGSNAMTDTVNQGVACVTRNLP